MTPIAASWRVRRTGGLLVPGFTKRFDAGGGDGMTYFLGMSIGRFDVVNLEGGACELRYRRWPVIDVLDRTPTDTCTDTASDTASGTATIPAAGFIRLPGGRRIRFCRFELKH